MTARTLADVATSAAAAVGTPGVQDTLGVGPCRQVIVCLIDGLGANLLAEHTTLAPGLTSMSGSPVSAAFPTTTPVGLASFGTGLLPGAHGLVGASFLLPETDEMLNPLHWGSEPTPVAVQPEPTVFERVSRAGIRMTTVSPSAYRDSGLTRAVLRGGDYLGADDLEQRLAHIEGILGGNEPSFTYVYWFELDRLGHEFGVDSDEWRAALGRADELVSRLLAALVPGTTLVVTADHGMVDCPPGERVLIEEHPELLSGVLTVSGDPRARHVYAHPGAARDVRDSWQAALGDRFDVLSRAEIVDSGLMGAVDPSLSGRIGDVMAISRGHTMLSSHVDPIVSQLIGQHGALSPDEVQVPALVHRCA